MHLALYRKYRATSLDQIIGQPQVTDPLAGAIKHRQISHAYLFIGPRGTGKTSVARILAHAINNFPYDIEDHHLDIIEIDAASNTGVDNIRDLREKALIAPSSGKYKVYIIDEVHMLSKSAFNALLKTLEEPPAHVVFIMATTDAHKVPITITSRSQVYQFKLADLPTLTSHLQTIATAENIAIEPAALEIIATRGRGSFRDALSLLDQISTLESRPLTAALVNDALGLPDDTILRSLLAAASTQDLAATKSHFDTLISTGLRPENIAESLIELIISSPSPATLPLLSDLIEVPRHPFPAAKLLLALLQSGSTSLPPVISAPQSQSAMAANTSASNPASPSAPGPALAAARARIFAKKPATVANDPTPDALVPKNPPSDPLIQPTIIAKTTANNFNWEDFKTNIKLSSSIISSQLERVAYRLDGNTLHLIPATKVIKNILDTPKNRDLLLKHLGDLALAIDAPDGQFTSAAPEPPVVTTSTAAPGSSSLAAPKPSSDPLPASNFSAIMGAAKEVNINHDDIPV